MTTTMAMPKVEEKEAGVDGVLQAIDALGPSLRAAAEETEQAGQLRPDLAQRLRQTHIYRLSAPREVGGLGASPRNVIRVISALAAHDPSTAWAAMALQFETGTAGAYLGEEAVQQLFTPQLWPTIAGQGTKLGTAHQAQGGYVISGNWGFASGMPYATHIHTAAEVTETGERKIFVFPKTQASLEGNWDVMGLQATGSIDYSCENVFVPAAFTHDIGVRQAQRGGPVFNLGLPVTGSSNHAGWALGVAERMLEEVRLIAKAKAGNPMAATNSDQFYAAYADMEASHRAARALLFEVWEGIEAEISDGSPLSLRSETLARLALNKCTWTMRDISSEVYKWSGTAALRRGDLQRYFRDANAGTQHVTSGPRILESCGKVLSGMATTAEEVFQK